MTEDVKEDATQDNTEGASEDLKGKETTEGEDTDTGEGEKTEEKTAEITLKLPDGSLLTPADAERLAAYAKAKGLSQEAAQELLDRDHNTVKSFNEAQKKQLEDMKKIWVKEIQDDPEFGGKNAKKNREIAIRGMKFIGKQIGREKELEQILTLTGLGDNPVFIRAFHFIGKKSADDNFVHSKDKEAQKTTKKDAEVFYGATDKKEE